MLFDNNNSYTNCTHLKSFFWACVDLQTYYLLFSNSKSQNYFSKSLREMEIVEWKESTKDSWYNFSLIFLVLKIIEKLRSKQYFATKF